MWPSAIPPHHSTWSTIKWSARWKRAHQEPSSAHCCTKALTSLTPDCYKQESLPQHLTVYQISQSSVKAAELYKQECGNAHTELPSPNSSASPPCITNTSQSRWLQAAAQPTSTALGRWGASGQHSQGEEEIKSQNTQWLKWSNETESWNKLLIPGILTPPYLSYKKSSQALSNPSISCCVSVPSWADQWGVNVVTEHLQNHTLAQRKHHMERLEGRTELKQQTKHVVTLTTPTHLMGHLSHPPQSKQSLRVPPTAAAGWGRAHSKHRKDKEQSDEIHHFCLYQALTADKKCRFFLNVKSWSHQFWKETHSSLS